MRILLFRLSILLILTSLFLGTVNAQSNNTEITQSLPLISVTPTSISGTTTNCDDSLFIPITIKNTGSAALNYTLDSNNLASDPLKVLLLTYGTVNSNALISMMGETFTNYQLTIFHDYNVDSLQSKITGMDVVMVPYISSDSYEPTYMSFAETFRNFTNNGGAIIYAAQQIQSIIEGSNLWPTYYYNGSSSGLNNASLANHTITNNITTADLASISDNFIYTYAPTPPNFTTLISYNNFSNSYKIAGYFPYGNGQVFYLGFVYTHDRIVEAKLLSNSLKWLYDKRNSWLSCSTNSGTINPGDSAIINVELNSLGLISGTYTNHLTISSNSNTNPSIVIPCTLTVVGIPDIYSNMPSVNFNAQFNNVAAFDSIKIYNSGCGELIISGITTNNTAYSVVSYKDSIFPGDSTWVVYKLSPTTSGTYSGTSTIVSNAPDYTISLAGATTDSPIITINPSPLNITIPNCNDSIITNLQIQNTGSGTLITNNNYSSDSAHIIVLTYGTHSTRVWELISSFDYTFDKYDYIEVNSTDPTILQDYINSHNANIIIIPSIFISSDAPSYANLATSLQNFANAGGTVIINTQFSTSILIHTGLISGVLNSPFQSAQGDLIVPNSNDPITKDFPTNISSGSEPFYYYTFSGTGITSLIKYGAYDVCVRKQYGAGNVIVIGFSFYNVNNNPYYNKQVLSNSIKASTTGVDWMDFTNNTSTLSAGASAAIPITFSSTGLAAGVYYSSINITTNIPNNPIINVPLVLTVQNQIANGINLGNDSILCKTQYITLDAGSGFDTYNWSNGSTNQTVTIDSTGIGVGSIALDVEVVDNLGCIGKDTIMITFVDCTGLNNVDGENFIISIYPNPTKGKFTISSNETSIAKLKLEVLELNGRLVYENQLLNTRGIISEQIDLSHRAKGVYIVRLSNGDLIKTFKVVVQ